MQVIYRRSHLRLSPAITPTVLRLLSRHPHRPPPSVPALVRTFCSLPSDETHSAGSPIKQSVLDMKTSGVKLTAAAAAELMKSLRTTGRVEEMLAVWREMKSAGAEPSLAHYNCLMECLINSGFVDSAEKVFHSMPEAPDAVSYKTLITGYCESGRAAKAVELFNGYCKSESCKDGKPFEGLEVVEEMLEKGFQLDLPVYNALIESFGSCGRAGHAVSLFERMKNEGLVPNEVTYSAIINTLCKSVMFEQAQSLFDEMLSKHLLPDSQCYNALIDGFVMAGRINDALNYAKRMEDEGFDVTTVHTYTVLIHGLFTKRRNEEAIKLWYQMVNEKGIIPTEAAFRVFSRGLCLSGKFNIACKVIDEVAPLGLVVENAYGEMLDVLCEAGRVKQACVLADGVVGKGREIPGRIRTVMINALRKAGNADLAIKLMHSKIGIGYERFGSVKRRVKFQTLFD